MKKILITFGLIIAIVGSFITAAGIYENKVVDAKELLEISKLPSFEESLMILGNALLSPVRNLSIGLNMLVEQGKIKSE